MSRQGMALFMTLGILIAYLIISSMVKTSLFSLSFFKPDKSLLPVIFYSALADFVILMGLHCVLHNVRLYPGALNDDATSLGGLLAILIGWGIVKSMTIVISLAHDSSNLSLIDKPSWETIAVVLLTLATIVFSREILIRGFLFQYLARGFSEGIATWSIAFCVALMSSHVERYSMIEFINVFLFNVVLCYCYRIFHDLWIPTMLTLSMYVAAFFSRLPLRELSFIERPNMLTGLQKGWFGTETTIFAGIPMTIMLIALLALVHFIVINKKELPLRDLYDPDETYIKRRRYRIADRRDYWAVH